MLLHRPLRYQAQFSDATGLLQLPLDMVVYYNKREIINTECNEKLEARINPFSLKLFFVRVFNPSHTNKTVIYILLDHSAIGNMLKIIKPSH